MKQLSALLAITILLASCNQYQKTKSGMPYKITKGGNGVKVKQGQFLKFNVEFKVGSKDSILTSSFGHIPAYMRFDTAQLGKYNFTEVLPQTGAGDKIEFTLSIDTLKNMGMIPEFNAVFKKGAVVKGRAEIIAIFDKEEDVNKDYVKENKAETEREIKDLEAYVAKKGIKNTIKTPGGTIVEIITPGDMSLKADSGKQASVIYTGYTEDGKEFDGNDSTKGKTGAKPLDVVVGARRVIPGWDEGLKYFGKGTTGRIMVPAMMAYGQQGSPPMIKPFSNLIFDIKVVDVTTPPPPPPAPTAAMPNAPKPAGK